MKTLNNNDFLILAKVVDKERSLGNCEARGTNKQRLSERSNLSMSTVTRSVSKLLEYGFIGEGIKQINSKTYYITQLGRQRLKEITSTTNINDNFYKEDL